MFSRFIKTDKKDAGNLQPVLTTETAQEIYNAHHDAGTSAISQLSMLVDETESDGWEFYDNTEGFLTESKKGSANVIARATLYAALPGLSLDDVENFLWNNEYRTQYDEFTQAMILLAHYVDDFNIVSQVFKGRFGISGRDFLLVASKKRIVYDDHHERLVIAVKSVSNETETEQLVKGEYHPEIHDLEVKSQRESDIQRYFDFKKKLVRGNIEVAGFVVDYWPATDVERRPSNFRIVYLFDADVKTTGVPQWIVKRVKLDQLRIVQAVPDCIIRLAEQERTGESMLPSDPSSAGNSSNVTNPPETNKDFDNEEIPEEGADSVNGPPRSRSYTGSLTDENLATENSP